MKKIVFATLFCIISLYACAQDTTYVYYNKNWEETTRDKMEYFRKKFRADNTWSVIDCYKSGKKQMTGTYLDDSCKISQGIFSWYNEDGIVTRTSNFQSSKKDGMETICYGNGKKRLELHYRSDELDGDCIGYYESGKISGRSTYAQGKQINGEFFNEDGSINKNISEFESEAEFPGGLPGLAKYLSGSLSYPSIAMRRNIQGSVIVQFIIDTDGSVKNVEIASSVDPSLDREAVRVIRQMPRWKPAYEGGRLVKFFVKQPVTFKLQ